MPPAGTRQRRGTYDFELPEGRIAQQPPEARGGARSDVRLLTVHQDGVAHGAFDELPRYLRAGDAFVVNNARVVPSILRGVDEAGDQVVVEIFSPIEDGTWQCMVVPERACRSGARLTFGGGLTGELRHEEDRHVWRLALDPPGVDALEKAAEYLYPYYIKTPPADPESYQTVYASRPGSTGLPSAGRHLTHEMLAETRRLGVTIVELTLFISLRWTYDGFRKQFWEVARPAPDAEEPPYPFSELYGPPRPERYELSLAAADTINERRRDGGRIVACGTSVLRTLETVTDANGHVYPGSAWTSIFIVPGHEFRSADAFLTNFHMPMSTELLLTSAFVGSRERTLAIYRDEVLPRGYAFHEFGDSMLVVRDGERPSRRAGPPPTYDREDPARGLAGG